MPPASTPPHETPLLQAYPPILQNRNFLLLWAAYVISALGDRIQMLVALHLLCATILQLYRIDPVTGAHHVIYDVQHTAQLTLAMLVPFALLGPFTGLLADRLPRRTVMITADLLRAAIIITIRTVFLMYEGAEPAHRDLLLALLFGSEFAMACCAALFSPARSAMLPNIVHPDQLLRATSFCSAAGTIASLVGFVVGGALIAWRPHYAMYAGAVTFTLSATFITLMRVPRYAARSAPTAGLASAVRDFFQGLRYIRHHRHVWQIIGLMLIFWGCGTVILNGLTGVVTDYYGLSEVWFSYFMGFVGLGMIAGAMTVSLARRGIPKEVGIAWAMVGVGVSLFLFSIVPNTFHLFSLPGWVVALVLLMLGAFLGAIMLVSLLTLLARITPDYVRGRVMGVSDIITTLGLLSAAVPLAISPTAGAYMRPILSVTAVLVFCTGVFLVIYYYRRQTLPWKAAIALRFARAVLSLLHRYRRVGPCRIPATGPCIVVANHSGTLDPVIIMASSPYRLVHFMMAKEYYHVWWLKWLYDAFGAIPVNRSGNDTASIRTVLRLLEAGECVGMFPEGRITLTGQLQEPRQGVALFVLKSGATVVPAYIAGAHIHTGMVSDVIRPARYRIRYGTPLRFQKDDRKARDDAARQAVTDQIMTAIAHLRDQARAAHDDPYKPAPAPYPAHVATPPIAPAGGGEGADAPGTVPPSEVRPS